MAKKRKSRSIARGTPVSWSPADITTLLSYLDHSLSHKGEVDFELTVINALNGSYTIQQVESKLKRLWGTKGPDDIPGIPRKLWSEDVYGRGSKAFDNPRKGLTIEEQVEIAAAVKELESEFVARQLATASARSRRLRSDSRAESTPTILPSTLSTPSGERKNTPLNFRQQALSVTPSGVKREIRDTESSSSEPSFVRKRPRTYVKRTGTLRVSGDIPRNSISHRRKPPNLPALRQCKGQPVLIGDSEAASDKSDEQLPGGTPFLEPGYNLERYGRRGSSSHISHQTTEQEVVGNSTIRCVCGSNEELSGKETSWIQCSRCHVWQHIECVKYLCDQCMLGAKPESLEYDSSTQTENRDALLSSEWRTSMDGAKLEIQSLRKMLEDKERELREEKDEVRQLQKEKGWLYLAQTGQVSQQGQSIEGTLKLHQKIHKLNAELDSREKLGTFTKLGPMSRQQFCRKFDSGLRQAYCLSTQTLFGRDSDEVLLLPPLQQHTELKTLVFIALGLGGVGQAELEHATSRLSKLSPQAAVRALNTAALQAWIFETPFPSDEVGSSLMLELYRESIIRQDGCLALRNLDLSALHELVKGDLLTKQIIPAKAAILAIRLSQTLAPLFSDTPEALSERSWDNFATWRDKSEDSKQRQQYLNEMFNLALIAKAESCLNVEDYEMVIYAPGTRFDKNTMTVETMEGMPDIRNHDGRSVQVCTEAALFSHSRGELSHNEAQRARLKPLIKAVVILKDEVRS